MNTRDLTADAQTVSHLAVYLTELKAGALAEDAVKSIQERGYVTPTEEQRLRQLQISYWQSRCALMELVQSHHAGQPRAAAMERQSFLIAFAGALLLVDAARFLREQFHEVKPIRHKLDEIDLQFGVPEGMYSMVQKSLTHPLHAWHLHHAVRYFDENRRELQLAGSSPTMAPVWDVIERLHDRVRVSPAQYLKTRTRVRARRVGHHVGRDLFGRALYGLQKVVASMMADRYVRSGHHPSVPQPYRNELASHFLPGDVLVVRKEFALTNYFLPGYWPHAALYLGDAQALESLGIADHEHVRSRWAMLSDPAVAEPCRVLEAMKDGVRIRPIDSPLASDSVVILRPQLGPAEVAQAICRALLHEGKPYDFDFDFNRSDRLVCTEVVYRAYDGLGGIQIGLTRRAGRNTLSAGDLVRLAVEERHFRAVALYSPRHASKVLTGAEAHHVLCDAEGHDEIIGRT